MKSDLFFTETSLHFIEKPLKLLKSIVFIRCYLKYSFNTNQNFIEIKANWNFVTFFLEANTQQNWPIISLNKTWPEIWKK